MQTQDFQPAQAGFGCVATTSSLQGMYKILVDESLILAYEFLILADESLILVDESLILAQDLRKM